MFQSASFATRYWNNLLKYILSVALTTFVKTPWVTIPVSEFLFDGYADPLLSVSSRIPGLTSLPVPMDRVGIFHGRNESANFDGVFNVETGTDDVTKRGILRNWNYKKSSSYDGECGGALVSTGQFFPPVQTKHTTLEVFFPDACR